jgi:hypothetical protein
MNVKDKDNLKKKILNDEDFIYCPRLANSLERLMEKHPNGLGDERICKILLMSQEELDETFESAILKLRESLGVYNE